MIEKMTMKQRRIVCLEMERLAETVRACGREMVVDELVLVRTMVLSLVFQ